MGKDEQLAAHPQFPWLWSDDAPGVGRFLNQRGWLRGGETVIGVEPAGEGNMNLTLRVRTSQRSLVLKQARPWVEKYDHIAAPWDRALFEERFYERVQPIPHLAERMPRLLAADGAARVLLLEDLAPARDLTSIYAGEPLASEVVDQLADYLVALHTATRGRSDAQLANREMRTLNHLHIYRVPLDPQNGLDLDAFEPGLTATSRQLQQDAEFCELVRDTGQRYLADGECLVHGDYFPGSWLQTAQGIKVIDPEFCFCGDAEFDVGVAVAHLVLANRGDVVPRFLQRYESAGAPLDHTWVARYAACEVMRRLLGVAQLPIAPTTGRRSELLGRSRRALIEKAWEALCH